MTPARRATIIDVAARAGVSRQTVSRAMNDLPGISAGTRDRVLEAAEELNYRPSRFGRGLVEQGPVTLGLVVDDLSNAYFAELGASVVRTCAPHGWNVVLAEAANAPRPEAVVADLARRVDAVVGYGVLTGVIPGGAGMPVVQLDGRPDQLDEVGIVELVRRPAMEALATHLAEVGVRRPLVLDLDGGPVADRCLKLADALSRLGGASAEGDPDAGAGVPIRSVDPRDGHREFLQEVLTGGTDALVAFNDVLAVRLLRALRELDVAVPERLRLVGVDGLEISALVTPQLTTLAIDIDEIARCTVELVAGMLDGTVPLRGPEAHREVAYRLEVRDSA
jgi:DNA-binding LacI/PurR family transcriptional regulator